MKIHQLAWLNPANQGEQNTSSSQANSTNVSGNFNVPLPFIPSPVSMATNMPLQLTSVCAPLGVSVEQKIREKLQRVSSWNLFTYWSGTQMKLRILRCL